MASLTISDPIISCISCVTTPTFAQNFLAVLYINFIYSAIRGLAIALHASSITRHLRFFFILIGGLTGMYGIILAAAVLCMNICAINPYGVPYCAPISPFDKKSLADLFYRQSWLKLSKRKVRINNLRGAEIDVKIGNKR